MEPKKSSKSVKIAIVAVLIISLLGCSLVAVLWWKYRKDLFDFERLGFTNKEDKKEDVTEKFSSDSVFKASGDVVDLVSKVSPAVVTVVSKSDSRSIFSNELEQGSGTGFFVSKDGILITNEHVVCESSKPENLTIVTSTNKSYKVEKISTDPVQDIAILKVDLKGDDVSVLKFANPDSKIQVGQDVIAVGNPLGINPGSVTRGIISGLQRNIRAHGSCQRTQTTIKDYEGVIQTDAAINAGNSGGPLINMNGEVIGVNSATSGEANNISYSVPFDRVLKLLERYQKNNKLTFPYIGVEYTMVDSNLAKSHEVPPGALVRRIVAGSPAEKAGIKRGDLITKIGDKTLDFSLQTTLNLHFEPNQKVKVQVYRFATTNILGEQVDTEGKYVDLEMTIGEK